MIRRASWCYVRKQGVTMLLSMAADNQGATAHQLRGDAANACQASVFCLGKQSVRRRGRDAWHTEQLDDTRPFSKR
jgi:hypothetical protein